MSPAALAATVILLALAALVVVGAAVRQYRLRAEADE